MTTWTLYTSGADVGTLSLVLNGVAMLCQQTSWIWGFASLAAIWHSLASVSSVPVNGVAAGKQGAFGPLIAALLALVMTSTSLQCKVQVESTRNGNVTEVANVPMIVAIIPVVGSLMSKEASALVRTVFGNSNPNYDVISASGNGFIDPMKRLLAARSAIQRLGGINSEIQSVVAACLGGDAGTDFAAVNNLVVNAGNYPISQLGAVFAINNASPTSIGVLLGQAALNTTAVVYDLNPTSPTMLSCPAAAQAVANDIDASLTSADFARVVQGGVNGMDEPDPGADHGLARLSSQYNAMRRWSTVVGNLAGGQQQANAELINLLFAETVASSLHCLKASDVDRANCEAGMVQAVEIERANLQSAAAEAPAVAYIGAFARYILALVIALGPIILMLAMFAGLSAGKAFKSIAQILLWPMLAMDVGAEIINGMLIKQFSDFAATVAQQGFLSPATMYGVYRELSLQVGVGSNIMASLPVIMGTIFGFTEAASLKGTESAGAPQGKETAQVVAPSATEVSPLTRQSSPVAISQAIGHSRVQNAGALEAAALRSTVGTIARDSAHALVEADTRQRTISEGQSLSRDWHKAFQTGNYEKFNLSREEGESIRLHYEASRRVNAHADTGKSADANKQNTNRTQVGASGNVGLGFGKGGGLPGSFSAGVGANASTQTSASDNKSLSDRGSESEATDDAQALSKALNSDIANRISKSKGRDKSDTFRKAQTAARKYDELLSHSHSLTDNYSDTLKQGNSLVTAHNAIGAGQIAYQLESNVDYQRFHADRGVRRDMDPKAQKYLAMAEQDMAAGVTESVEGNTAAKAAVLRTRAAALQFSDPAASEKDRVEAMRFLTDSVLAMTRTSVQGPKVGELERPDEKIPEPKDRTGSGVLLPTEPAPAKTPPVPTKRAVGGGQRKPAAKPKTAPAPVPAVATPNAPWGPIPHDLDLNKNVGPEGDALNKKAVAIEANARNHIEDAEASGLAQNGPGTIKRTGQNVVDNAADLKRPADQTSQVRYGKKPPVPTPAPPAPPSPSPSPNSGSDAPGSWG